jgi:hypothetical protein
VEWVSGEMMRGLLVFVAFVCVWVYVCCSVGLCHGLQGLGLCKFV